MRFHSVRSFLFLAAILICQGGLAAAQGASPGGGELRITGPAGEVTGLCPLQHTDVQADVIGTVARVCVGQTFVNATPGKIEAVYVFPLPENAAVDDMTMIVGQRRIVAQIKPREEARAIYDAARARGNVAGLLDQERANIFTQSVTNIEPGAIVQIEIRYNQTLRQENGNYQFVFPMVVGPRFIPGAPTGREGTGTVPDTTRVPDASRISPPVPPPGVRAGHDITIVVSIDAPMGLGGVKSVLHDVDVAQEGTGRARVSLKKKSEIPNKDFILNFNLGAKAVSNAFYVHQDPRGQFFLLLLQPPQRVTPAQALPKEMIFVIDRSGSMSGQPIEKAKEAMKLCIEGMNPGDTFDLLSFSNTLDDYLGGPVPNTPANRTRALELLAGLAGNGGTNMMPAMEKALGAKPQPGRVRTVCFMTDGFVGNDMEVLNTVQKYVDQGRIFSFGIGNSVNRYLLEGLARAGRGDVEFVTLADQASAAAARFAQRIQSPVLTDIQLDWGDLKVEDVYPARIPDVFSHTPILVFGRLKGSARGTLTLRGQTAAGPYVQQIQVAPTQDATPHEVIPSLWARAKVEDLMLRDLMGAQRGTMNAALKEEITGLGVAYRIMTQFTSFVAVEELNLTVAGEPKKVAVPVEMPEGVSQEGVFGINAGKSSSRMLFGAGGFGGGGGGGGGFGGGMGGGGAGRGGRGGSTVNNQGVFGSNARQSAIGSTNGTSSRPANPAAAAPPVTLAAPGRPQTLAWDASGTPATPETKLAEPLRGLAAKVAKDGREGTLTLDKLKVVGYKVDVMITLMDLSDATRKALTDLGFSQTAESSGARLLIGTIDVRKLEDLAKLAVVLRIAPVGV